VVIEGAETLGRNTDPLTDNASCDVEVPIPILLEKYEVPVVVALPLTDRFPEIEPPESER
jgi:hypothetical protein